jgi:signal peptidase II
MAAMTRTTRLVILLAAFVVCIGCDQATKSIAQAQLMDRPSITLIGDTITLTYVTNAGGFLGLGANLPASIRAAVFGPIVAIGVVAGVWVLMRHDGLGRAQSLGISLLVAGAAGNLIDRLVLGTVRDFLIVAVGPLSTGIFNVADMAAMAGVALVLADPLIARVARVRAGG